MIELSHKPLIRAFCCNCMEFMAGVEDKAYELAIVDPPYSKLCNLHGGHDQEHGWGPNWVSNKHHGWNERPQHQYFADVKRVSTNQIIWGGNYFLNDLEDTACIIIWDKGQRDFSLADGELAWTSFNKPLRIFSYARSLNNKTDRIHVNQKPVALYRWLLTHYAKPGQRIFDSHGGSFSSAIACWHEGYDMDIIELDTEYFDTACERFERETRQKKLFGARP